MLTMPKSGPVRVRRSWKAHMSKVLQCSYNVHR